MSHFRFSSNALAYADNDINSNPARRFFDWSRVTIQDVENPKENQYVVDPGATLDVFSGVRSTSINNLTEFLLSISPLSADRYRLTWTGTGANPAFRTDRLLSCNGSTLTWVVNINQTVSVTSSVLGEFTTALVGDTVFVPGVTTGDVAGPFDPLNEGYWQILGKDGTSTTLQMVRLPGVDFSAFGQAVVVTDDAQFQAFSATGVQVGDKMNLSAGFGLQVLKTYTVFQVNPEWVEFVSTEPLPVAQLGVPTAIGLIFYFAAKRFMRVEADQECVLRQNGDTSDICRLSPWVPGDSTQPAEYVKTGPTWSLSVVNKSSMPLNVLVTSVE